MRRILLIASIALAGCTAPGARVATDIPPSPDFGYVAGDFTLNHNKYTTAFVLTNVETKAEHIFSFTNKTAPETINQEVGLMQLAPGTYRIDGWILYGPALGGPLPAPDIYEIENKKLTVPFIVRKNEVVFLGKFNAASQYSAGYFGSSIQSEWEAEPITRQSARATVMKDYPLFEQTTFSCILCL